MSSGGDSSSGNSATIALLSALAKVFLSIVVGWMLGSCGVVPAATKKGISPILGKVTLPALLFHGMATTDLGSVRWLFFAANVVAKLIIGGAVVLVTVAGSASAKRSNVGKAGVFLLFSTRTAVWSLGLPVFRALWPAGSAYSFVNQLPFVCAPVDNLVVMPVALFMMHLSKLPAGRSVDVSQVFNIVRAVSRTPAVIMVVLGLVSTLALGPDGLPALFLQFVELIASAYPFLALFSIGLGLAAGLDKMGGFASSRAPVLLIVSKLLLLPIVTSALTLAFTGDNELAFFGFLYGAMPTSAAVVVFANQSTISARMLTTTVLWCTLASGPLLLVTGLLANGVVVGGYAKRDFLDSASAAGAQLRRACDWIALISAIMSLAMLVWWSRFRARAPRRRASASVRPFSTREPGLSLVLGAQVCASAAASGFLGAFCVQDGATVHPASKARTGFDIVMLHSSRVWIALLGIAVAAEHLHRAGTRTGSQLKRRAYVLGAVLYTLASLAVESVGLHGNHYGTGCYLLHHTTSGFSPLRFWLLLSDSISAVALVWCVFVMARYRSTSTSNVARSGLLGGKKLGMEMIDMARADAPGVAGAVQNVSNPGVMHADAVSASPKNDQPGSASGRDDAVNFGEHANDSQFSRCFAQFILYEMVICVVELACTWVPAGHPSAMEVLGATRLLDYGRGVALWLFFGPSAREAIDVVRTHLPSCSRCMSDCMSTDRSDNDAGESTQSVDEAFRAATCEGMC